MNQEERQELVKYRITKARETFNEIALHVENNLWIYDPPKLDEMISILRRIQAMGFEIGGSEATVATSDTSPDWVYQDKMRDVKDKTIAQGDVYGDILSAYLAVGAKEWGFGSPSDRTEYFDVGRSLLF